MNYSPYKPFRIKKTFSVDTYNNDYVEYTIQFGRYNKYITQANQWVTIYRGKSLVIERKTEVDIATVVRDYAYRKTFDYDFKQGFKPENLSASTSDIENIEMGGDIANSVIKVTFYYNGSSISEDRFKFSIYGQENTPYDGLGSRGVRLYQNSRITNHVPLIFTNNYWVSFDYAKYFIQNTNVSAVLAGTHSNGFVIQNVNDHGNYSEALTLNDIYTALTGDAVIEEWYGFGDDVVFGGSASNTGPSMRMVGASVPAGADVELWYGNRGDVVYGGSATVVGPTLRIVGAELPDCGEVRCGDDIIFGYQLDDQDPIFNDVLAKVDCCPDEWYLSWNDSNGWHSVGLRSAWEVDDNERLNIVNIYDEERNVNNTISKTFKVQSKKLNYEELNEYYNILESTYVILYNSSEDRNYFCNLVNTSVDRTKKKDQKFFECEIKEIINSIN